MRALGRAGVAALDSRAIWQSSIPDVAKSFRPLRSHLALLLAKFEGGGCTYILFYCSVFFTTKEGPVLKAKYTLFTSQELSLGWKHRVLIAFYECLLQTRLQAGQGYGNTLNCVLTVYRNESVSTLSYLKCAGRKCK